MSKKTTAVIKARRKTPPVEREPAGAPHRPIHPDEVATAAIRKSDPHRIGLDNTDELKSLARPFGTTLQFGGQKQPKRAGKAGWLHPDKPGIE